MANCSICTSLQKPGGINYWKTTPLLRAIRKDDQSKCYTKGPNSANPVHDQNEWIRLFQIINPIHHRLLQSLQTMLTAHDNPWMNTCANTVTNAVVPGERVHLLNLTPMCDLPACPFRKPLGIFPNVPLFALGPMQQLSTHRLLINLWISWAQFVPPLIKWNLAI
jgi:hypothetical protein